MSKCKNCKTEINPKYTLCYHCNVCNINYRANLAQIKLNDLRTFQDIN